MTVKEYRDFTNHIGIQYPFYLMKNPGKMSLNFNEIIADIPQNDRILDVQSVIEICMRQYILTDRTLIKGINRYPYMGDYKDEKWAHYSFPEMKKRNIDSKTAAEELLSLLKTEIKQYIGNKTQIGILLSGGMDSRILAGVLKSIQNETNGFKVIVYSWGIDESRDKVYSKEIANRYHWEYKPLILNSETLLKNFKQVMTVGAEIIPYNLHNMVAVRDDQSAEVILAGSYGDTVGRGEYNGVRIDKAPEVILNDVNKLGVIKNNITKRYKNGIIAEQQAYKIKNNVGVLDDYLYREIEYHQSHTRRFLTTAMSIIAQKKPVYQIFTHPETVEYIWSLPLDVRYDKLYSELIRLLPSEINNIPWARTGKPFGHDSGTADQFTPYSHRYGLWLRTDLKEFVLDKIDFELLDEIGIFNLSLIDKYLKVWGKTKTVSVNQLDSFISWLACFCDFFKEYGLSVDSDDCNIAGSSVDSINSLKYFQIFKSKLLIREMIRK